MSIADQFLNKTQRLLLTKIYGNINETFYQNELIRYCGTGQKTVTKVLKEFVDTEIVVSKKVGNQIHYQANTDCLIFEELHGIMIKTFAIT